MPEEEKARRPLARLRVVELGSLMALLRECDVLVENFRPGTLERWGLAPETLLEANPRLVIARVSGEGQTGPRASRPGPGCRTTCRRTCSAQAISAGS